MSQLLRTMRVSASASMCRPGPRRRRIPIDLLEQRLIANAPLSAFDPLSWMYDDDQQRSGESASYSTFADESQPAWIFGAGASEWENQNDGGTWQEGSNSAATVSATAEAGPGSSGYYADAAGSGHSTSEGDAERYADTPDWPYAWGADAYGDCGDYTTGTGDTGSYHAHAVIDDGSNSGQVSGTASGRAYADAEASYKDWSTDERGSTHVFVDSTTGHSSDLLGSFSDGSSIGSIDGSIGSPDALQFGRVEGAAAGPTATSYATTGFIDVQSGSASFDAAASQTDAASYFENTIGSILGNDGAGSAQTSVYAGLADSTSTNIALGTAFGTSGSFDATGMSGYSTSYVAADGSATANSTAVTVAGDVTTLSSNTSLSLAASTGAGRAITATNSFQVNDPSATNAVDSGTSDTIAAASSGSAHSSSNLNLAEGTNGGASVNILDGSDHYSAAMNGYLFHNATSALNSHFEARKTTTGNKATSTVTFDNGNGAALDTSAANSAASGSSESRTGNLYAYVQHTFQTETAINTGNSVDAMAINAGGQPESYLNVSSSNGAHGEAHVITTDPTYGSVRINGYTATTGSPNTLHSDAVITYDAIANSTGTIDAAATAYTDDTAYASTMASFGEPAIPGGPPSPSESDFVIAQAGDSVHVLMPRFILTAWGGAGTGVTVTIEAGVDTNGDMSIDQSLPNSYQASLNIDEDSSGNRSVDTPGTGDLASGATYNTSSHSIDLSNFNFYVDSTGYSGNVLLVVKVFGTAKTSSVSTYGVDSTQIGFQLTVDQS